jgi:hypothetical protein
VYAAHKSLGNSVCPEWTSGRMLWASDNGLTAITIPLL